MARRRTRRRGFKPYRAPTRPPASYYDPALDAQERAGQRGLGDLMADTQRDTQRGYEDYFTGQGDINRERDQQLQDLGTQRTQGVEDYKSAIGNLDLRYKRLGGSQAQGASVAGVGAGGALSQALRKRTANYGLDKAPIDTQQTRFLAANDLAQTRTREAADRGLGALAVNLQRGVGEDMPTAVQRAQREQGESSLDISKSRFYQATGAGWNPDRLKPGNEFTRHGLTYRTSGQGLRGRRYTLPSGQTFNRRQWLRRLGKGPRRLPSM